MTEKLPKQNAILSVQYYLYLEVCICVKKNIKNFGAQTQVSNDF